MKLVSIKELCYDARPINSQHLNLGFPKSQVPSGFRRVNILQGSSSCILQSCPSHLNIPISITLSVTHNYISGYINGVAMSCYSCIYRMICTT